VSITGPSAARTNSGYIAAISGLDNVTVVSGEPRSFAVSVAWGRSSGPALLKPIVNDGTA
jgi:hypothetical protein